MQGELISIEMLSTRTWGKGEADISYAQNTTLLEGCDTLLVLANDHLDNCKTTSQMQIQTWQLDFFCA